MFADETNDLRPQEYYLSVNIVLLPKKIAFQSAGAHAVCLVLLLSKTVNGETVADAIGKVCRNFHADQSGVLRFAHHSALCMTNAAERLKTENGRGVLVLDGLGERCAVMCGAVTDWGAFGISVTHTQPNGAEACCSRSQNAAVCRSAHKKILRPFGA